MRSVAEMFGHERRVDGEIHASDGRIRAEARPVEKDETPPLGEWSLFDPRRPRVGHTPVHEENRRAAPPPLHVQVGHRVRTSASARARTRAPSSHCSGAVYSSGLWLIPPRLGTKSIAEGTW